MTPYWHDDHLTVYGGDCREVLAALPAESVHMAVTSPPYYGLRDYGLEPVLWGGDPECEHKWEMLPDVRNRWGADHDVSDKQRSQKGSAYVIGQGGYCEECGGWLGNLGLEPSPHLYVTHLVEIFRELRRVLRHDGIFWLNLGDSYNNRRVTRPSSHQGGLGFTNESIGTSWRDHAANGRATLSINGGEYSLKEKDLVGIPWRVAFALQADGWYLRSDIIWAKPNPMPESVTDRPTKAHEYLFLLSKAPRYFYDADAVSEAATAVAQRRLTPVADQPGGNGRIAVGAHNPLSQGGAPTKRDKQRMTVELAGVGNGHHIAGFNDRWDAAEADGTVPRRRNLRTVWTIATQPYPGAHFATFPPKLVEPCIKAGCPADGTVLDPFAGTGTVGLVANALGRRAVLIDLNPDYLKQCLARNAQAPLGLSL